MNDTCMSAQIDLTQAAFFRLNWMRLSFCCWMRLSSSQSVKCPTLLQHCCAISDLNITAEVSEDEEELEEGGSKGRAAAGEEEAAPSVPASSSGAVSCVACPSLHTYMCNV